MAVHALDFGDYTMAVCLFKRALSALNDCFALVGSQQAEKAGAVRESLGEMRAKMFDLREIWLRVISDCREDSDRQPEEEA
jgi:hypothetical protein